MTFKVIFILFVFFLTGCQGDIYSYTANDDSFVSINYPVTNIGILDEAVSSYVNRVYGDFKSKNYKVKPEINISYTYKEVNDDVISIGIKTEIVSDTVTNKIKTFVYNKKSGKFLSMEDIASDMEALDFEIKKRLLEKYQDADMDYLSNMSYDFFTIDDENLTLYFNPIELKSKKSELIYLDISLDSLDLLIDVQDFKKNDVYLSLKKREISDSDKVVALTFDDGPSKYTSDILKILKDNDACATFFVIGNKVSFYSDVLRDMLTFGNEIGNHSYDHKYLKRLSENEFKAEIDKTQEEIKKVTGFTPTLFRPTYGGYSNILKTYTDLTFVLWDVDSRDWSVKNSKKVFSNVVSSVKSGSIVLMHDNHVYAVQALEDIIRDLKDKGYKFVTVSELLKLKKLRDSEWVIMI